MNRSTIVSTALLLGTLTLHAQTSAMLNIEVNQTKSPVSPILYGLMTEEINYSYDGGLYAEMVRNRTFRKSWSGHDHWLPVMHGGSSVELKDGKSGPSTALASSLLVEVTKASKEDQAGSIELQLVSLFPPTYHDRANGNRPDIMKMMAEMHPHFLRLPGGNYLEGDTIKERFNWKETIGPLVDRPTHRSPWNYQSTD